MSIIAGYDVDRLVMEFRVNGFVVFDGLIGQATLDRIQEAWTPIRDADIERQGPKPVRGRGRYNVRVPFRRPFVDAEIFEHPALVAFLEAVLGKDYVWPHFDSNVPLPGTDYQGWHRDGMSSPFPGIRIPTYQVGVKFPLVETSEENGSFEVVPCSQYVGDDELPAELDELLGRGPNDGATIRSRRLNLKRGALWVHDNRVLHRGTPNRSDHPRDELCMAMNRPWVFNSWQHEFTAGHFPRDLWDSLSDHAREVLRLQRLAEKS